MKRTLGLGCILLVGVALVTGLIRLSSRDRQRRAAEQRVDAELAANSRDLAALLRHRREAAAAARAATPAPPGRTTPVDNVTHRKHVRDTLHQMPEYAPYLRRELRRRTMRAYAGLFAQLKLSPERLGQLKQLLDDAAGAIQDAMDAADDRGIAMGTPAYSELVRRYQNEATDKLRAFLGPDDYAEYTRYRRGMVWSSIALPEFAAYLGDRRIAGLSSAQEAALTRAYVTALYAHNPPGTTTRQAAIAATSQRIAEFAGPALEPAQRNALVGYLAFVNNRNAIATRVFCELHPDRAGASIMISTSLR